MIEVLHNTEKEKVMEFIKNPVLVSGHNRMGCNENWYNPYYAIKETFSLQEITLMSTEEVSNLVKLAGAIGEALY